LEKFHINPNLVVALEEDETHNIALDSDGKITMQLTLIDANHCIGACMFLLEGYFGNILHTGDFRYDALILEHAALREYRSNNKILDLLCLDDTFLDPDYDFPTREVAGNQVLQIIDKYAGFDKKIVIGMDTLGKEELLIAISLKLKSLIVVEEERLNMLNVIRKVVNIPDVFTHDENQGRVIVVKKKDLYKKMTQIRQYGTPVIGIMPSGWSASAMQKAANNNWVHMVPYSLHSSYNELITFVRALTPRQLYSVSKHNNANLRMVLGHLCSENHSTKNTLSISEVPRSVRTMMELYREQSIPGYTPKSRSLKLKKVSPTISPPKTKGLRIGVSNTKKWKDQVVDLTDSFEKEVHIVDENTDVQMQAKSNCEHVSDLIIREKELEDVLHLLSGFSEEQNDLTDSNNNVEEFTISNQNSLTDALNFVQNLDIKAFVEAENELVRSQISNEIFMEKDIQEETNCEDIIHNLFQYAPKNRNQCFESVSQVVLQNSQAWSQNNSHSQYNDVLNMRLNNNNPLKRKNSIIEQEPNKIRKSLSSNHLLRINPNESENKFESEKYDFCNLGNPSVNKLENNYLSQPRRDIKQVIVHQTPHISKVDNILIEYTSPKDNVFLEEDQESHEVDIFSLLE
jgi:hypothetical protein